LLQKPEILANDYFQFKQFIVWQDRTAMKVGTDGVLLGAWADVSGAKSILDVGTGTGLIALMIAQRSQAKLTALEIEEAAYLQARDNIRQSPWHERIVPLHCSFQDYSNKYRLAHDRIITNPPYFNHSLASPDKDRTLARHSRRLSYEELLEGTLRLMEPHGKLSLILPWEEGQRFLQMAGQKRLFASRQTIVYPRAHKKPARILMELGFDKVAAREDTLTIEKEGRHRFTEEYMALTRAFYLNF